MQAWVSDDLGLFKGLKADFLFWCQCTILCKKKRHTEISESGLDYFEVQG